MCINPFPIWLDKSRKRDELASPDFYVNCGHCAWCRLNRAKTWTCRLVCESWLYKKQEVLFCCLTYDDAHLPEDRHLKKDHIQAFNHRFQEYAKYTLKKKVRYYVCGEYGDHTHRPHYHAIYYGVTKEECVDYMKDSWSFGSCNVKTNKGTDGFKYVCSYVQKKLYGKRSTDEFSMMSRRPGLGYYIFKDPSWIKYLLNHGLTCNGHVYPIPRYFRDFLKNNYEKLCKEVKDFENLYDDKIEFGSEEFLKRVLTSFPFLDKLQILDGSYKVHDEVLRLAKNRNEEIKFNLSKKGGIL